MQATNFTKALMCILRLNALRTILCLSFVLFSVTPTFSAQFYLEDADSTVPVANPNMPSINNHLWPRIMMAETQSLAGDIEIYSKYQVIAAQAGVIKKVAQLQEVYPNIMYFRMYNPHEYAGYGYEVNGETCTQGNGIPFNFTTPATGNCGVYAGHWLYRAGTTTTQYINTAATSVPVQDASLFTVGEYAVIYDAPAGSFNNAEHVLVTSRNTSTNTLTISRAYKSTARVHAFGSIIAHHVLGQSAVKEPRNWVFNLGINGPQDANGLRYVAYISSWLRSNYKKTWTGELTKVDVSGFLFDSDADLLASLAPNETADMDNNLVVDKGLSSSGVNWYAMGIETFYSDLRGFFPNHFIVGGTRDSLGFDTLNGVQMEGFPAFNDFTNAVPSYERLDGLFARYRYQTHQRTTGPAHNHVLSKIPSALFPVTGNPTNNQNFRFAFGLTLLEDGYFVSQNSSAYPDIWYDEYAVDVTSGSSTYGYAIASNQNEESAVRAHVGWLGQPQGQRKRIYNDSDFTANSSLLQQGTFENSSDLAAWRAIEVTTSIATSSNNVQDGARAIHVSEHLNYQKNLWEAGIRGPDSTVIAGRQYTFVFSAKASTEREITAQAGGHAERFLLGPEWQRFVMTFTAQNTGSFPAKFNVGTHNTETWFDSAYLFEGNANVFRRDFDNGIVVVNATPITKTISLDGAFMRINGPQQPVNDGAIVSSVTLYPYDAAVLVRPDDNTSQSLPIISISPSVKSVQEGSFTGLTISANKVVSSAVSVEYITRPITASSGLDYVWARQFALIPAGSNSVNIAIETIDDTLVEVDETFKVDLIAITSNAELGTTTSGVITILDNDTANNLPIISISPATISVAEGSYTGLTISADKQVSSPVTVEYQTRSMSATTHDFEWVKNTAIIPAGQTSVNIAIKSKQDRLAENDEFFVVDLNAIISGSAILGTQKSSLITILDLPVITVTPTKNVSEGNWVNLTISSNRIVSSPVTIKYTTRPITALSGVDYAWAEKYAVIPAGSKSVNITIQTKEDSLLEADKTFRVELDVIGNNANLGTVPSAVVTILDDETTPTISFSKSLAKVTEGKSVVLTVQSDRQVQQAVSFEYQTIGWTADPTDFVWVRKNATISQGGTTAQIKIQTISDDIADEPEEFRVRLNSVTSGNADLSSINTIPVWIQSVCEFYSIPLKNKQSILVCL